MMCYHAAMKGVCDTPLHLFDHFTVNMMVERNDYIWRFSHLSDDFNRTTVCAYRIHPQMSENEMMASMM